MSDEESQTSHSTHSNNDTTGSRLLAISHIQVQCPKAQNALKLSTLFPMLLARTSTRIFVTLTPSAGCTVITNLVISVFSLSDMILLEPINLVLLVSGMARR